MSLNEIKRDTNQDVLKGLGIILVVVGHALRGGLTGKYGSIDAVWFFVDFLIYAVHMPLFFFLAGLNSFKSMNKGLPYLKSRFPTILKPYLIFSIIYFTLNLIMQKIGHVNSPLNHEDILKIWYAPISLMWFLYALFVIQITVFFSRKFQFVLVSLFLLSLVTSLFLSLKSLPIIVSILAHAPFFIIGYWFSKLQLISKINFTSFKWKKIIISFIIYFSCCYIAFYQLNILPVSPFMLPTALIGIYILYLISNFLIEAQVSDVFLFLGKLSLPIYLLHLIPLAIVPRLLMKFQLYNQFNNIILGSIFSILMSITLFLLIKRFSLANILGIRV